MRAMTGRGDNDTSVQPQTHAMGAVTREPRDGGIPMRLHIKIKIPNSKRKSVVMLEQVRTIDKSRLLEYIGKLDNGTMKKIDNAVKISFDIDINDEKRNNDELYRKN